MENNVQATEKEMRLVENNLHISENKQATETYVYTADNEEQAARNEMATKNNKHMTQILAGYKELC